MDFQELYTETASRLGDQTDPTLLANSKKWLNQQYNKVVRELMAFTDVEFWNRRGTFTPNSSSTYTFPAYVGDIVDIKNNIYRLRKVRLEDLDSVDPQGSTAGTPWYYYSLGTTPVYQQPSAAGYLSASSTSSSDLTQEITIRGLLNGVEQYETITLSGTNVVSSLNQYDNLYLISKNVSTNGVVTVIANAGAVSNSILAPGVLENQYIQIGVYPTNSSVQHTYTFTPAINNMVSDGDVPNLPTQFHQILIDGAEAIGRRWMEEFDSARECEMRFLAGIEELKGFVKNLNEYQMQFAQPGVRSGNVNDGFSPYYSDNFMAW